MNRLKVLLIIFCLALAVPSAYFILRTYQGMHQEEVAELRFFGETLFDQMEEELAGLVRREEARAMDEYGYHLSSGGARDSGGPAKSTLTKIPDEQFILGYLQNSPDGSFQTPLVKSQEMIPWELRPLVEELGKVNTIFNQKRLQSPTWEKEGEVGAAIFSDKDQQKEYGIGARYLRTEQLSKQKATLGQEEKRIEKITVAQARNIVQQALPPQPSALAAPGMSFEQEEGGLGARETEGADPRTPSVSQDARPERILSEEFDSMSPAGNTGFWSRERSKAKKESVQREVSSPATNEFSGNNSQPAESGLFQVEVDPLQSLVIDRDHVFIFRRIVLENQIYRQGFVLKIDDFLRYLGAAYFQEQPLARFTHLRLVAKVPGEEAKSIVLGAAADSGEFVLHRVFPRPFAFLTGELTCDQIPPSTSRNTLGIMMAMLVAVLFLGLFAIYRSAEMVLELSERRTGFVSSVTHELKTPLTTIRMYIEMLEQGIARDRQREADYFRILRTESERLTRLINNVLEFSRLEKRQRRMVLSEGTLEDVIAEVSEVMAEKIRREGFTFTVMRAEILPFPYDREAMVQIFINLLDNSLKFGQDAEQKVIQLTVAHVEGQVEIRFSDTGPGLPSGAVKKVFDDFYRVDNTLTRRTKGTGIGLALVKKLVQVMGGRVRAANNQGPGCTIIITLPVSQAS